MPKPPKSKPAADKPAKTKKAAAPKAPAKAVSKAATKARAADLIEEMPLATPDVLDRLFAVVSSRRGTDTSISHSARLLARGRRKIAQKFGEEAVECLIEAVAGNRDELISESADVLYHLIVMWVDAGVEPGEVWSELLRREGTSGIAEKAARPRDPLA
ncbi:phosphoribosyl-ATP diphosphatase [Gluconacetobacter entanii]|uniref:phosphoribosyl-ATP diphosphatase n=1 Tax=Gluconacetobacter entanii TaxID=108528 RepID=UPI001494FCC2|nr:phosphoribosyl-ATP diphosphatase [Komagataeibacter sp. FXV2]MBY4641819.1 phosphoribosyl-ATP diphosphatase [Gluconacetobacter entanii]NPC90469.1 phosphoribosyl-ATP diphosphatase [Gluconacetobacter entanii]